MTNKNSLRAKTIGAILLLSISLGFISCKKDKPEPEPEPVVGTNEGPKVFVVNEGNFMSGNASISLFNTLSGTAEPDYFSKQNNGALLGDVAQSMVRFGDEYFVVVNNSGKIVVCGLDLVKKAEITGFTSPRYIQPIGGNLAYVSDYSAGKLFLVDLGARSIISTITLPGELERMEMHNNRVYVCNASKAYLYVIDAASHTVSDSIFVGEGASSLVFDKNNKLWVLASSHWQGSMNPRLNRVNPDSMKVETFYEFASGSYPVRLCANVARDSLFYLLDGVNYMALNGSALPATPLIASGTANFNALKINPRTHEIYVSDVIDYVQRATVIIYDSKGNRRRDFKAGIMATDFYFE